jgi:hypothetical protein
MIKPIQTEYNGYKFRSRLEARWAVFFDHLDIDYDYEIEGFHIGRNWYLPDFYLSHLDLWVEIKPKTTNRPDHILFDHWQNRLDNGLVGDCNPHNLNPYPIRCAIEPIQNFIIICGTPGYRSDRHHGDAYDYQGFIFDDDYYFWCQCIKCKHVGIEYLRQGHRLRCSCDFPMCDFESMQLVTAYKRARSADFRHGRAFWRK